MASCLLVGPWRRNPALGCRSRQSLLLLPLLILGASAMKRGASPHFMGPATTSSQVEAVSETLSPAEAEEAEEADGHPGPPASVPEVAVQLATGPAWAPAPEEERIQYVGAGATMFAQAPKRHELRGPAPAPATSKHGWMAPTPAPAPLPASDAGVLLEVKVTHLDYDELMANPSLVDSFTYRMQEAFAFQAGGGLLPSDVAITLYRGSVLVDAFVSLAHVNESAANQAVSQLGGDGLAVNMAAVVSEMDGISAISTGVLGVEVSVLARRVEGRHRESRAPAPAAAPAAAPEMSPAASDGFAEPEGDVCYPHCVEGHGICAEGVCHCRAPYHGIRCHLEKGADLRIDLTIACLLVFIALCLGTLAGCLSFAAHLERRKDALTQDNDAGSPENDMHDLGAGASPDSHSAAGRNEVWRPLG